MMIDELIRQLQNPDPALRKRAILALGKSKAPSALKPLANVVRNDPDPELRELARKAGQYIRQQMQRVTRNPAEGDLPTTGALIRSPQPAKKPGAPPGESLENPPMTRRERKAAELARKSLLRPLDDDTPETGALLGNPRPPTPAAQPPASADDVPETGALLGNPRPVAPFISDGSDDNLLDSLRSAANFPDNLYEDQEAVDEAVDEATDDDESPLEPLRAPPLYYDPPATPSKAEEAPQPVAQGSSLVKGRKYNVSKQDEERARGYLDAALSFNLSGDNAKAMKNLTEAISLNPNLINDAFFNNVAASITGLEGDAAAQMIIDRNERQRFTSDASRKQKDQRVEKHLTEAQQSGWADVGFEIGFFAVVVIVGTLIATLVANEALKQLLANFAQVSKDAPEQLQAAQASLSAITLGTILLPSIVSGVVAVLTLLLQTVLIHYLAKMMGGIGTWRHLVQVLLSFYNRWTWLLFVILCISLYVGIATVSPVTICPSIILLVLALYITGQTSSKVGAAYDFGGAKGCVTVILSSLVILLINFAVSYVMFQSVSLTISRIASG